ncbi:HXXEE domain-containing protein [Kalamiella sp. sgz302252]|uniref:HXXEE domain-containing protein n=1 Tax=Pantoea sp. sgz302252 TaxID=3341827 RepID=UPI0036D2D710
MDEALVTGVFIFIVHELEELVFLHGWARRKCLSKINEPSVVRLLGNSSKRQFVLTLVSLTCMVVTTTVFLSLFFEKALVFSVFADAFMLHALLHCALTLWVKEYFPGTLSACAGVLIMLFLLTKNDLLDQAMSMLFMLAGLALNLLLLGYVRAVFKKKS